MKAVGLMTKFLEQRPFTAGRIIVIGRVARRKKAKKADEVAKSFGVSKQVTIIRLRALSKIDNRIYSAFKKKLDTEKISGFGRRNWERTYVNRTSRLVLII